MTGKADGRKGIPAGRFLLWMDMEGVSQINDYREILPIHQEYWKNGRMKFTQDAVAAAKGLLDGGAREVAVIDGHGLGWPNLIAEELPRGARPFRQGDAWDDFEGLLLVGFHARCGTPEGFMSHTFVPYLRVAVNDSLVTECHVWALRSGIPVLGVIGDGALGVQLDGILAGTPFLEVKKASTRSTAYPTHPSKEASTRAIASFAQARAKERERRVVPKLHAPFSVSISMPHDLTSYAEGRMGFTRKSKGVLVMKGRDWKQSGDPAIDVAMGAAVGPLAGILEGLDIYAEQDVAQAPPKRLDEAQRYFADWASRDSPAWQD